MYRFLFVRVRSVYEELVRGFLAVDIKVAMNHQALSDQEKEGQVVHSEYYTNDH